MDNKITCGNCGTSNIFYLLNCKNCNAIIRDKVVNIDLWKILWQIIETPAKALTQIVQAEHKNFSIFLAFTAAIKIFFHTTFISTLSGMNEGIFDSVYLNGLLGIGYFLLFVILFSLVIWKANKASGIEGRFKDYYALLIYGLTPLTFSFAIFTTLEYALFGKYWLMSNPSAFALKPMAAYVIAGLEFLMLIWSVFLIWLGMKLQTGSALRSVMLTGLFFMGIALVMFILPYFPF